MTTQKYKCQIWRRLTQEQIRTLGISTYKGEVILIDQNADHVTQGSFYFNAQEFFSDKDIAGMEVFGNDHTKV